MKAHSLYRSFLQLITLVLVFATTTAHATNGYFLIGHGIKARGMGGVGIALAQQGQTAAVNPAGLVDVGTRLEFDAAIFKPDRRSACCLAPGGVVSGANYFFIPSAGAAYKFNRKLSMGFAAVGAGASTRFEQNFFFDDPTLPGPQADESGTVLGINLIQLIMAPGVAYNFNKQHSFGAALQIGVQTFRGSGMGDAFTRFSLYPNNLTEKGNDWSYGAGIRVGWRGKFFKKKLLLGATYASRTYMTEFDKYKGLFAEEGDFDIPENYGVGLAYKPNKKLTLAFDYMRINYSDVASVGNPALPISSDPANTADKLGASTGPGFDWENQDVFKVGIAYDLNDKWTLRTGFNYGKTPIQENDSLEFNVLAPATTEKHITVGGTYQIDKSQEISFAYQHGLKNKLQTVIANTTQLPFSGPVETELRINIVEIGYAFHF
jgi:long-chain fatty acid transport protein